LPRQQLANMSINQANIPKQQPRSTNPFGRPLKITSSTMSVSSNANTENAHHLEAEMLWRGKPFIND